MLLFEPRRFIHVAFQHVAALSADVVDDLGSHCKKFVVGQDNCVSCLFSFANFFAATFGALFRLFFHGSVPRFLYSCKTGGIVNLELIRSLYVYCT